MNFSQLPKLIGITGLAGSGKDTIADWLVAKYRYQKVSISAPIKRLLNERFGWTNEDWEDRKWKETPALASVLEVHDELSLSDPMYSPRQMAQWLGTEVGRAIAGDDVWINAALRPWNAKRFGAAGMENYRAVLPDVRFDNEARAILAAGGCVIRVVRPGVAAVNAHVSERGVSDELVQAEVSNHSSKDALLIRTFNALLDLPKPN